MAEVAYTNLLLNKKKCTTKSTTSSFSSRPKKTDLSGHELWLSYWFKKSILNTFEVDAVDNMNLRMFLQKSKCSGHFNFTYVQMQEENYFKNLISENLIWKIIQDLFNFFCCV